MADSPTTRDNRDETPGRTANSPPIGFEPSAESPRTPSTEELGSLLAQANRKAAIPVKLPSLGMRREAGSICGRSSGGDSLSTSAVHPEQPLGAPLADDSSRITVGLARSLARALRELS